MVARFSLVCVCGKREAVTEKLVRIRCGGSRDLEVKSVHECVAQTYYATAQTERESARIAENIPKTGAPTDTTLDRPKNEQHAGSVKCTFHMVPIRAN